MRLKTKFAICNCQLAILLTLANTDIDAAWQRLPGYDPAIARQVQAVEELAAGGHADDALAECLRLVEQSGDRLIPDPKEPGLYRPAHMRCQELLLKLPPAQQAVYRLRADNFAMHLFKEGVAQHRIDLLYRVSDQFAASSIGPAALEALADLLFERGRFAEAEEAWRHAQQASRARKPPAETDQARLRAKELLVQLWRGRTPTVNAGLTSFVVEYPKAAGRLAGKYGNYADTLRELAHLGFAPPLPESLSTFAGNAARNAAMAHLQADPLGLLTSAKLQRVANGRFGNPLVLGDDLVFAVGHCIQCVNLTNGRLRDWHTEATNGANDQQAHAVTWADGRVFACLEDYLVCLDAQNEGALVWRVRANPGEVGRCWFEAAPLAVEDKLYVAVSLPDATAVYCYQAATGSLVWKREVVRCAIGASRSRHHHLTLAGRSIVYVTNLGIVAAFDAGSGQFLWATVYESKSDDPNPNSATTAARDAAFEGDANPCEYSDGRVYLAPRDFGRLCCLDAISGRTLWETAEAPIRHILGITAGRVLVTTASDLRALDVLTGEVHWRRFGATMGRGLIAGDLALWPTAEGVRALRITSGEGATLPQVKPGLHCNILPAGKRLLLLTPDALLSLGPGETHP